MSEQDELLKVIEPIIVKVFEMGIHTKGDQATRTATIEWGRDEVLAKAKQHYEQNPQEIIDRAFGVGAWEILNQNLVYLGELKGFAKRLDRPKLREIDEIVVKIWNMSKRVSSEGYQTTRIATLEWARGEILALIPNEKEYGEQYAKSYQEAHKEILEASIEEAKKPLLEEIKHLEGIIESLSNR